MIVIFENMARKVDLISKYNETEQLLAEKKKKLAEVNDQIEDILCRQGLSDFDRKQYFRRKVFTDTMGDCSQKLPRRKNIVFVLMFFNVLGKQ